MFHEHWRTHRQAWSALAALSGLLCAVGKFVALSRFWRGGKSLALHAGDFLAGVSSTGSNEGILSRNGNTVPWFER